jgi:argininosuccinate lyase
MAKTGKTPNLSMLNELSLKVIHEKLSGRGLSEKAIEQALDPMENVKKRNVTGGPAPEETKRQVATLRKKLAGNEKDIKLFRKKINRAGEKLNLVCRQYS